MPDKLDKSKLVRALLTENWYELPELILSYGSAKSVKCMLAAIVSAVATGHLIQSIFSMAVLMMLISLTSCFKDPLASSHPFKEVSPVKSSFEKFVRAGSVRIVSFGRLLNDNVEMASSVVEEIDSMASESAMLIVPVTAFRPLSVMSAIPFAVTDMFPVNVVHWLSLVMSSAPLILRSPEQSVRGQHATEPECRERVNIPAASARPTQEHNKRGSHCATSLIVAPGVLLETRVLCHYIRQGV